MAHQPTIATKDAPHPTSMMLKLGALSAGVAIMVRCGVLTFVKDKK
jgi:hypothetical protein